MPVDAVFLFKIRANGLGSFSIWSERFLRGIKSSVEECVNQSREVDFPKPDSPRSIRERVRGAESKHH